jgi:hypothetical protein
VKEWLEIPPATPAGQGKGSVTPNYHEVQMEDYSQRSCPTPLSSANGQEPSPQGLDAAHPNRPATRNRPLGDRRGQTDTEPPSREPHSQDTAQHSTKTRTNPIRSCRPPDGNTEHLTLLLDTIVHGKLPDDYQPIGSPAQEIIQQADDILNSWVAQSHFFPEAGLGFFFEIKGPYQRRGGALLAIYYGHDSFTRKFSKQSHKQLTELWSAGGFALSHRGANYVVNGDPACGPS